MMNKKLSLNFTRQIEQLINSGISIKTSLEILSKIEGETGKLSKKLISKISCGESFYDALKQENNLFSAFYLSMIDIGEKIGSLKLIFKKLKEYLERKNKIQEKLINSIIYPIIIFITAIVSFLAIIIFVLPKIEKLFEEISTDAIIQIQISIKNLKTDFFLTLMILFIILILYICVKILCNKNENIKEVYDSFLLKIPFIRKYLISWDIMNFSFAMEIMSSSKIKLEDAMNNCKFIIKNKGILNVLLSCRNKIIEGYPPTKVFSEEKYLPEDFKIWFSISEETGNCEESFKYIRIYYEKEIENLSDRILILIEPLLILIIGIMLLSFISSIIVPIFSLYGTII